MEDLKGVYVHAAIRYAERLEQLGPKAWIAATSVSAVQFLVNDAFFWMWIILSIAAFVDWIAGRWAIRATQPEKFSRKRSREGMYGKALGMIVLALLRSAEALLPVLLPGSVPSTRGLFASIIAVALFIDEMDSIDRHRQTLGMPPIPMLSWVIARLRSATGAEQRALDRRRQSNPLSPGDNRDLVGEED